MYGKVLYCLGMKRDPGRHLAVNSFFKLIGTVGSCGGVQVAGDGTDSVLLVSAL